MGVLLEHPYLRNERERLSGAAEKLSSGFRYSYSACQAEYSRPAVPSGG